MTRISCIPFVSILLALALCTASAGQYEDGLAALDRDDYRTALRLLLPLAEHGQSDAQLRIGMLYEFGKGVPVNDAEALKWYRLSAAQGNAGGQFALGFWAYRKQNYIEAVKWLRRSAKNGHLAASSLLGEMYATGQGVRQDNSEAIKWYRFSAKQGDSGAQANLGRMYLYGIGVTQSYADALKWLRLSAEKGNAVGQLFLAGMYLDGVGVPRNYVRAHMWFNLAASRFGPDENKTRRIAVRGREEAAANMNSAQITEAQRLAREWKPMKEKSLNLEQQKINIP